MSKRTYIFIAAVTVARAYLSASLQLHPDEAYYWLFSRHLDLSYFDHPPMVAYFIRLTTIFSDGEFFVRFSALATSVFLSFLIWKLAGEIFNSEVVSFWSVVILNLYPVISAGIVITPDVPSFLFWGVCVFIFWRIVNSADYTKARWKWLYLGVVFGLSLLSKYTSVLFGLCVLFFLLVSGRHRFWLKTIYPYLAGMIALLIFSPVVLWNYQNDWASFRFQWEHGTVGHGSWENVLVYLGGQAAAGGIFLFLIGAVATCIFLASRDEKKLFLVSTSLPVFLFFGWAGFKKVGEMNWPAPAFLTLSIITSAFLFVRQTKIKALVGKASVLFVAAIILILYMHAGFGVVPLAKINKTWALMDPTNRFYGWKEFALEIEKISAGRPVIAIDHQSASEILYYTNMRQTVYAGTNNYKYWQKGLGKISGGCVAYDYSTDVISGPVEKWRFKKILKQRTFEAKRGNEIIRKFNIYDCMDFSGF